MQNRIEYLRAKYNKPIDESVLRHIASDLVDGKRKLGHENARYNHKLGLTTREKVRKYVDRIRELTSDTKRVHKGEIKQLKEAISNLYKKRIYS